MNILYIVIFAICIAFIAGYKIDKYQKIYYQNTGEALIKNIVLRKLSNADYHILNNITIPVDDGTTQIDHILVSRYGIFVIETKDYSGWIFGDENNKYWTHIIFKFKCKFQNPIRQNYKHLIAIKKLLDFENSENIHSLIVFTGNSQFKTKVPSNVIYVYDFLEYIKSFSEIVLSENRMQFCIGRIEAKRYQISKQTDIDHQTFLANKYYRNKRK